MCAGTLGDQEGAPDPLELEFQGVVSHLACREFNPCPQEEQQFLQAKFNTSF